MSFDARTPCDSCGCLTAIVVVTEIRQHRRSYEFRACPRCHADYERQCAANRKDEERERLEREERLAKAKGRDTKRRTA